MFNANELESSNHQTVMDCFSDLGYEVRWQQVCPSTIGIPMTRRRLHYQGLLRTRHEDPKGCMDKLKSVWEKLAKSSFISYPLADFLVGSTSTSSEEPEEPQKMAAGKKWKAMHKDVFEQHEAQGNDRRFGIHDVDIDMI